MNYRTMFQRLDDHLGARTRYTVEVLDYEAEPDAGVQFQVSVSVFDDENGRRRLKNERVHRAEMSLWSGIKKKAPATYARARALGYQ